MMDRDHLAEVESLGKLTNIKTLSLSNNKLTTLPEDIGLVKCPKVLSLHGNHSASCTRPSASSCSSRSSTCAPTSSPTC